MFKGLKLNYKIKLNLKKPFLTLVNRISVPHACVCAPTPEIGNLFKSVPIVQTKQFFLQPED